MDNQIITTGIIGTLLTISLALNGVMFVGEEMPVYQCEERSGVHPCYKLSKVNADGLSTRCYWNENNPRGDYLNCGSGWEIFEREEVIITPGDNEAFYCGKGNDLIRECKNSEGLTIYRVKNE